MNSLCNMDQNMSNKNTERIQSHLKFLIFFFLFKITTINFKIFLIRSETLINILIDPSIFN